MTLLFKLSYLVITAYACPFKQKPIVQNVLFEPFLKRYLTEVYKHEIGGRKTIAFFLEELSAERGRLGSRETYIRDYIFFLSSQIFTRVEDDTNGARSNIFNTFYSCNSKKMFEFLMHICARLLFLKDFQLKF